MRLGLDLGYWRSSADAQNLQLAIRAEELGFDVAWAAEAYGSDAVTVLTWVAARTSRLHVGSSVMQIPARTPTMTAMTAATLDALSAGRFRLGLGISGPQVSEGWHGVRYARPLTRTREYIDVVRLALSREKVRYQGRTQVLPLPDGPGKALHLMMEPFRPQIPVYLAALGERNLELAGEIADGWLAFFLSPTHAGDALRHIETGRARAGSTLAGFDVVSITPLVVGDDVAACADQIRPRAALYLGGMGSREHNFYVDLATRMGYGDQAREVQDRYLARDFDGAARAVPHAFIDETSLLGPPQRIAERMAAFAAAGVTTLTVGPYAPTLDGKLRMLEQAAQALDESGATG
jgi:F420-dependent oxidoreductase-like protein